MQFICKLIALLVLAMPTLAALATSFAPSAFAQLYDPNNNCVYQPGSTECQQVTQPDAPQVSGSPYDQFLEALAANGIDMSGHGSYTEAYFNSRASTYCNLLQQQNSVQIQIEMMNVPSIFESNADLGRIEFIIMRIAALNFCRGSFAFEQQVEAIIPH